MSKLAAGCCVGLSAASLVAQQGAVLVEVRLPTPLASVFAETIGGIDGAQLRPRPASAAALPGAGTVVIAFEPVLQQLAEHVVFARFDAPPGDVAVDDEHRWLLPWVVRYSLLGREAVVDMGIDSFENLALRSELQDRLWMCAPDVDPAPWLIGMRTCLRRGQASSAGFGLWTALDARLASYGQGYDEALAELANGRVDAAIVPDCLLRFRGLPTGCSPLALVGEDGLAIGVAVAGASLDKSGDVVEALVASAERHRLADRLGLPTVVGDTDRFVPDDTEQWLRHFDERIRGKGRGVERVADALDFVFVAAFAVVLFLVWWRIRRGGLA